MSKSTLFESISNFIKRRSILFVLFALIAFFSVFANNFATLDNALAILRQISILGLFATGMMFVMIVGYIDLSIGSIASFASVWFGMMVSSDYWHLPVFVGVIGTLLLCAVFGLFNGLVITKTKMEPLICTLGTQVILSGVTFVITQARVISGLPESILFIGQGFVGKVPFPVIILGVILVIVWVVLNRTYFGRYFYAVGSNSDATRLSGIRTDRVKIFSFVICAVLCGLAGIVLTSRLNSGQPLAGSSYMMNALIACSLGGISLAGGVGGLYNLICGILILGVINNGMLISGFNTYVQSIVQGVVLVATVSIDYLQRQRTSSTKNLVVEKAGKH